jgi:peptide chain release factor 2
VADLEERWRQVEFTMLFSDDYDDHDAIVAIHAGAGGTDAQDWTEILLRMFFRFAEKRGWKTRVLDESRGGEAGIKSVTFEVHGPHAYGFLKSEAGVHRLVRISPFDAEGMRHTSFALVEVIPELDDVEEIPIDPKDLRIDTFLSSGHGGQSVQTTYSAVRVVHLPTKIMVSVQNERSQQQNKETAMKILKAKLHQLELQKREEEKSKLRGEFHEAAWGNQIRSYVMQPYRLVKDHRTKHETAQVDDVLNGELLPFMESYLRWNAEGRPKRVSNDEE